MSMRKPLFYGLIAMMVVIITSLFFSYIFLRSDKMRGGVISCASNVNFNLSDGMSSGPVVKGILYVNLDADSNGLLELSGTVKWKGETYPVSKRISIKHNLKRVGADGLVTISAVNSLSLEHDNSPPGVIEKYLIGDPSLPVRIIKIKRVSDSGYLISNLNSPVMICLDR